MKALLKDGTVIALQKECECTIHDDPHWLYMDRSWHARNQQLLYAGNTSGFMVEEIARLDQLFMYMLQYGIERFLE